MNRPRLLASALALALACVWIVFRPAWATNVTELQTRERALATTSVAHADPARETVRDKAPCALEGRCVDTANRPVAGVRIEVDFGEALGEDREREAETDASGGFSFHLALDGPRPYRLTASAEGFDEHEVSGLHDPGAAGPVILTMFAQCDLGLGIVDRSGHPVADVRLELTRFGSGWSAAAESRTRWVEVDTDDGGRCRVSLPEGRWRLGVYRGVVVAPSWIDVARGDAKDVLAVVDLGAPPKIRGRVVDEQGTPLSEAQVQVSPLAIGWATYTDAGGEFTIAGSQGAGGTVWLRASHRHFLSAEWPRPVAWGETVEIVLRRSPAIRVRVVRADTGEPVEDYALQSFDLGGRSPVPKVGHHPGGVVTLDRWANHPFRSVIQAIPVDHRLSPGPWVEFDRGVAGDFDLFVSRSERCRVRVEDPEGRPVSGSRVSLVELGAGRSPAELVAGRPLAVEGELTWFVDRLGVVARVWDRGTTDEAGEVELTGPVGRALLLRAFDRRHARATVPVVRWQTRASPLRIVLQRGGSLRGTLGPPALLRSLRRGSTIAPEIRLVHREADRLVSERLCADIDVDGRYRIENVPDGAWDLEVCWWIDGLEQITCTRPVATSVTCDGADRVLDLDLAFLMPGTLNGAWTSGDGPAAGCAISIRTEGVPGRHEEFIAFTNVRGEFRASLPGGRYSVWMLTGAGNLVPAPGLIEIRGGETTTARFVVCTRNLDVQVVGRDGKPRAGVPLFASKGDKDTPVALGATDGRGGLHVRLAETYGALWVIPRDRVFAYHLGPLERREIVRVAGLDGSSTGVMRITLPAVLGY